MRTSGRLRAGSLWVRLVRDDGASMFSDDDLIDCLMQAEEWRQQGWAFSVADLCPDRLEYWSRLEDLWQRMLQLDQQLHVAEVSHHESGLPATPPSSPLPAEA